jgi:hypothetical protein
MSDIGINELIINKVQERLDLGQKKYGQDVPLKDNRDYHQETIEELLDGIVYLTARLIQLERKEESNLFGRDY